ncbi:MAG: sterol desaturase family protein [Granulosicoccus sp.]|nr:sterol desaturase family protein [Granulosicoccus sp.]
MADDKLVQQQAPENAQQNERQKAQKDKKSGPWNHSTPVIFSPLFDWPPKPMAGFLALATRWVTVTRHLLFLLMAMAVYHWLLPPLSTFESLSLSWILPVYLRNLALMMLVAGGLHLYFFTFRGQHNHLKYDSREKLEKGRKFSFSDQVHDNMFWSLGSGVAVWTIYEVLYLWGAANGVIPTLNFTDHKLAFALWLLATPLITATHFYFIHRLLHWPPLFKVAHRLHHRNIHIGPWSGMSMHPIEHVLYVSSVLVHFVIPSHPMLALMHLFNRSLGPAFSHAGFEKMTVGNRELFEAADFHHQLHHRYFECNYGSVDAPWDRWLGTCHDGSDEATQRVRERQKQMYRQRGTSAV